MNVLEMLFGRMRVEPPAAILPSVTESQEGKGSERDRLLHKLWQRSLCENEKKSPVVQQLLQLVTELSITNRALNSLDVRVENLKVMKPFSSKLVHVSNWLALAVAHKASSQENSYFVERASKFLLIKAPFTECWLEQLLPNNQSEEVTERIFSATAKSLNGEKISALYKRLLKAKSTGITKAEALSLALFATSGLKDEGYYKKSLYGLSRSLQWDVESRVFYVFSKVRIADSGYKRVRQALRVPLDISQPVELAARAVNRYGSDIDATNLLGEVSFQRDLLRVSPTSTWPIWHNCTYTKEARVDGELKLVKKVSVMSPLACGTFGAYFKKASIGECLNAIAQLCEALLSLHDNNCIHGDLKQENILYKIYLDKLAVVLIDFGFTVEIGAAQDKLPGFFDRGFYGSQLPTAPEFLLNTKFDGDYKKLESWALGCMLYECMTSIKLPWYVDMMRLIQVVQAKVVDAPLLDDIKRQTLNRMTLVIPLARDKLLQGRTREVLEAKDQLYVLICDLLAYDPIKRLTVRQFLDEVLKLQKAITI